MQCVTTCNRASCHLFFCCSCQLIELLSARPLHPTDTAGRSAHARRISRTQRVAQRTPTASHGHSGSLSARASQSARALARIPRSRHKTDNTSLSPVFQQHTGWMKKRLDGHAHCTALCVMQGAGQSFRARGGILDSSFCRRARP